MVLTAGKVTIAEVQQSDRAAIREFVTRNKAYLSGRVLDFGCGKQPYRELVSGDYHGYDPGYAERQERPNGLYDAILITQVLQCPEDPVATINGLRGHLKPEGHWVVTYHPSWYEVENSDLWRYSRRGMEALLRGTVLDHEPILTMQHAGWVMQLTYGIVARNDA